MLENCNHLKISQPVFCLAAIANNNSFLNMLGGFCVSIVGHAFYKDHHNYTTKDIENIKQQLEGVGAKSIITTLKDFVKIELLFQ